MTDHSTIAVSEVAVGQEVTVWAIEDGHRTWGQGGRVSTVSPQLTVTAAGADHQFALSKFASGDMIVEVEVPTDPSKCVNFGAECRGEVEYFDPSGRGSGVQRCLFHRDQRAAQYAGSIEQYAFSAAAPSWFDPTYAGESWDEV